MEEQEMVALPEIVEDAGHRSNVGNDRFLNIMWT